MERTSEPGAGDPGQQSDGMWFQRFSRPTIFLIVGLAVVGAYLAFTIPVSVFPSTDFPRIVIGVDNGVAPIDQMLVTVTRPIEEAVNSVPGLQNVRSITSRGSAEIDLFFDWKSDMVLTLQRVDAVVARLQSELPSTAKLETHRLTFAAFPIIGYSLTSDTVPPNKLWEIATYDIKPRVNRLDGVATVVVQGGRVPEFQVTPDPARLPASGVTVTEILDAIRRTNLIDSPGLIESEHHLVLGLVSGQVRSAAELGQIVVKTSAAGVPIRIGDVATIAASVAPVYTMVTANGKPAVLLNVSRQPDSNTLQVANEVHGLIEQLQPTLPPGVQARVVLRSVDDCSRFHFERAGRGAGGDSAVVHCAGFIFAGLGDFAGGGAGDSGDAADYVYRAQADGAEFQPDDAGRAGRGGGAGDRRCHRGAGEYRAASRRWTRPLWGDSKRAAGADGSADWIDDYADRCFSTADFDDWRYWEFFPGAGHYGDGFAVYFAAACADVDADVEPVSWCGG